MSNKEKFTMAGVQLKKQQLRDDLELLEGNFENRIKNVKSDLLKSVNLAAPIKKNPIKAVGIAIAVGLVSGLSRRKKRKKFSDINDHFQYEDPDTVNIPAYGFKTLLMDEIKRIAARRAALYISEVMDRKFKR